METRTINGREYSANDFVRFVLLDSEYMGYINHFVGKNMVEVRFSEGIPDHAVTIGLESVLR